MNNGKYEYDKKFSIAELECGEAKRITNALISLALYNPDWKWVQDTCIKFSNHNNDNVRGIAILCFGHLARLHGKLETDRVLLIVKKALQDSSSFVRGHADSALDDIEFFCK
jgi:hypothetical protein